MFEKINSRLRAKSVSNSTIIGVQVGLDEHQVRTVFEQLINERLSAANLPSLETASSLSQIEGADSIVKAAPTTLKHVLDLEDEFERAIELIGAGRASYGEILLLELLATLSNSNYSDRTRNLRLRVAMRLGAIRRDRGHVSGLNGAFDLFRDSYATAAELGETEVQAASAISLAACYEMSERYDQAFRTYGLAHDLGASSCNALYDIWGKLRQQTVVTKVGDADSAVRVLEQLMPAAADTDTIRLHRVCLLKQAAAYKEIGDFDKALESAHDATHLLIAPTELMAVQHDVLLADVYLNARMEDDGIRHLMRAEERAIANSYAHQLKAIDNVLGSYLGIPAEKRSRPEVRQQFRPVTD